MTFFSILVALIAEQYRPVTASHWIRRMSAGWLDWVAKEFGGKSEQGATPVSARLACLVGFGLPTVLVFAVYVFAYIVNPLLAFVWNIIIVYPRLAAPEPKSGASANFATPAGTSIA